MLSKFFLVIYLWFPVRLAEAPFSGAKAGFTFHGPASLGLAVGRKDIFANEVVSFFCNGLLARRR